MNSSTDGAEGSTTLPAFEFNPYTTEFDKNPYPAYEHLRKNAPVYWWPTTSAWVISRYDDIAAALRDERLTPQVIQADTVKEILPWLGDHPLAKLARVALTFSSERDRARLRRLIIPAFQPRSVEKMREGVQRVVDSILARVGDGERMDIAEDFAELVPAAVMGELMGLPERDHSVFKEFSYALVVAAYARPDQQDFSQILGPIAEGYELLASSLEQRRKQLGPDLLSALLAIEEQGDRLSTEELISMIATLIAAGFDSTRHAICFAVYDLLSHPDQAELARRSPEMMKRAVEETLRYDFIGKLLAPRFANEDIEIRGVRIKKSERVFIPLGSALRDPEVFPDPDRFDIERDNQRSIPFSSGQYFCPGAHLARLQLELAIGSLFRKYPEMRLEAEPTFVGHHIINRKMSCLPVLLRP